MLNIIVTGGDGRFAQELKKIKSRYNFIFRNKKQLNILSIRSIKNNIKKFNPKIILHLAGLSRPMNIHDKMPAKSIDLNIIGTANLVNACIKQKKKLFFFQQVMFTQELKVTIKRMTPYYLGIITAGQNLVLKAQFKCIKIL